MTFYTFLYFFFKIDNIIPDPDPNWAEIQDSGSKFNVFCIWIHNTVSARKKVHHFPIISIYFR